MSERLKIGIVGCGAIAQIQYLPLLRAMADEFEIAGLADLSPGLVQALGQHYGVAPARRFTDYHQLVQSEVEAVIVCPTFSHAPAAIAAAEAGKHILVEKPMCVTVAEAEAMVAAAERAGVVLMVGYMKQHDPAYRHAARLVAAMDDVRFVQVNHLHPDNRVHLARFPLLRFDDVPAEVRAEAAAAERRRNAEALGYAAPDEIPPAVELAFFMVLHSFIHDIGNLHGFFGPPECVVSTEVWRDGGGFTTTLAYAGDVRAVCTWVDLPELPVFEETIEVYGSRQRVVVSFPTGFSLGQPTVVVEHGLADGHPYRTELIWHENPFQIELRHLRDCIRTGQPPLTDGRAAVADIALVRDIVQAYARR
jgi:predicted dehydrogenase